MENYKIEKFEQLNVYVQDIVRDAVLQIREKYKDYYIKKHSGNEIYKEHKAIIEKCFKSVEEEILKLKLSKDEKENALTNAKGLIETMFVWFEESSTTFDIKVKDNTKVKRSPFSFAAAKKMKITMKKIANNQYGYDIEYISDDSSVHYITDAEGNVISTVGNVDIDFNRDLAGILYSKGFNIEYFHKEKNIKQKLINSEYVCKLSQTEDIKEFVDYLNDGHNVNA